MAEKFRVPQNPENQAEAGKEEKESTPAQPEKKNTFMDIPTAAGIAGYSVKRFREILSNERIPIHNFGKGEGRKFKILTKDFEQWQKTIKPS